MLYLQNSKRKAAFQIHGEDEIPEKHKTQRQAGLGNS
jgi:hypothetical protein